MKIDFWIALKRDHQKYTKPCGAGYHFGCYMGSGEKETVERLMSGLARYVAKLCDDAVNFVNALDYRSTEVGAPTSIFERGPSCPRGRYSAKPIAACKVPEAG